MLTDPQIIERYGQKGDDKNIVTIHLPFPMRLAWDLNVTVNTIKCHKLIADKLVAALEEIKAHYGYATLRALGIDLFGGCYNVRLMRGSKTKWSRHSWAIALDLDPVRNSLKTKWKDSQFAKPEYRPLIEIFDKHGFINYGIVKGFDAMHFEIAA